MMAAADNTPFFWGSGGERLTPEAIKRNREMANALIKGGVDYSPIRHWTQGLSRVAQALVGGYESRQLDEAEKTNAAESQKRMAALASAAFGAASPDIPAAGANPVSTNPAGTVSTGGGGSVAPASGDNSAFPASLVGNESGGRWGASNNAVGAGGMRGHFGRLQFGQARLQEAMAAGAIPQGTTPQQFMSSPELQQAAERWHFGDIDKKIAAAGYDRLIGQNIGGVPITLNGMRAAAHLGGFGGLQSLITSGGRRNPRDANGTSLLDYMRRHGAAGGVLAGTAPASAPVQTASAGGFPIASGDMAAAEAAGIVPPAADAQFMQRQYQTQPVFKQRVDEWLAGRGGAPRAPAPALPVSPTPEQTAYSQRLQAGVEGWRRDNAATNAGSLPLPPPAPASIRPPAPVQPSPTQLGMPMPGTDARPFVNGAPGISPIAAALVGGDDPSVPNDGPGVPLAYKSPAADMPATGSASADIPSQGSSPVGFTIPPAVSGGELTTVPTPDDQANAPAAGVQPTASAPAAQPSVVAQALISPQARTAAIEALTSPYASQEEKALAYMILQKQMSQQNRGQWVERTLSDGSIAQQNSITGEVRVIRPGVDPLTRESQKLDVEKKRRELDTPKDPITREITSPDGTKMTVEWDRDAKKWKRPDVPVDPNAPKPSPKLTEQQSKDLTYYNRGIQALESFEKSPGDYASGIERFATGLPGGNFFTSEGFQKAQQSGRNFLASILRKDSGAAITTAEEAQYGAIFLPQPGDKPGTLAQKAEARRQAIEAIKLGLGPADILAKGSDLLKAPAAPAQPSQAPSQSGPVGMPQGARQAPDGNFYAPDPTRPGKWLRIVQ